MVTRCGHRFPGNRPTGPHLRHVVAQALGIADTTPQTPAGKASLGFPLIALGRMVTAQVVQWVPARSGLIECTSNLNCGGGDQIVYIQGKFVSKSRSLHLQRWLWEMIF